MKGASAIILAGGRGERMGILSRDRTKPGLPFGGVYHVIDFVLTNCMHSGIGDIAILTGYRGSTLVNYLNNWRLVNRNHSSFHIIEPEDSEYMGTADAVYQNIDYLRHQGSDYIFVLAADQIYKMDYGKILAFHQKVEADLTLGAVSVPIDQANRFGIIITGKDGRIAEFEEKPQIPRNNLISMGIYVFSRKKLIELLEEDAANPGSLHDFGHSLIPNMINRDKVFAYRFNDYWRDIGTVNSYYQSNMEVIKQPQYFHSNNQWPILVQDYRGLPPPKISGQAVVVNSVISPGCVIKGEVRDSVVSPDVIIEEKAAVRDSIIMKDTVIGKNSVVKSSIIDEGVQVGEFCYLGYGVSSEHNNADITVIGKNVTIPAYTNILNNQTILHNTELGGFVRRALSTGTVVA
jgi:glucose-1-phosphate adenylyltransferase